jgi:hypothetical protein
MATKKSLEKRAERVRGMLAQVNDPVERIVLQAVLDALEEAAAEESAAMALAYPTPRPPMQASARETRPRRLFRVVKGMIKPPASRAAQTLRRGRITPSRS